MAPVQLGDFLPGGRFFPGFTGETLQWFHLTCIAIMMKANLYPFAFGKFQALINIQQNSSQKWIT